ncbi:VWA domain-containing protein [bacterium]|nr:VWA domain-containing protein [bacterium]
MSDRDRRWRLLLGEASQLDLPGQDVGLDRCLAALYEPGDKKRRGGLGGSFPSVARWLGDIRDYFPTSVVQLMQKDAIDKLGLQQLLLEPEFLQAVEPDVHLVSTLLGLSRVMPQKTKATARIVINKVVQQLLQRLANQTRSTISGSLRRSSRTRRPRHQDIDWNQTIRANLKHYQPEHRTVIAETRIGRSRSRSSLAEVVLCVDQSGSMAPSVVYSSIFAAVLASLPALSTKLVVFDTAIVDLSQLLSDPVEVLFGTQLGGGTDIAQAVGYCQALITRPSQTVFVLVSDLCEGGDRQVMLARLAQLSAAGVTCVALLALSDEGAPIYDHDNAAALAALSIPSFGCTPDRFPDLMAAALGREDLAMWAARHGMVTA